VQDSGQGALARVCGQLSCRFSGIWGKHFGGFVPLAEVGLFAAASLALALAPGPDNLFVLTQGALYGWRIGVTVTLGLCTGLLAHTAGVAFGLAAFIQGSAVAFNALKFGGAIYLLYLAWGAWRAIPLSIGGDVGDSALDESYAEISEQEPTCRPGSSPISTLPSMADMYRRGLIMNILNPKVAIFFLAFLPQFVDNQDGGVARQVILLGAVFMLVTFFVFSSVAVVAGGMRTWFVRSPETQQWLNRAAAVVFVALALRLMVTTA